MCGITAAQCANELNLGIQSAGCQVDSEAALSQHGGFGTQDLQVVAQAGLLTLAGDGVCRLGKGLGCGLFGLLAGDGLARGQLVGYVMHGLYH